MNEIEENGYLIDLLMKKKTKEDKRKDYLIADQIFVKHFNSKN